MARRQTGKSFAMSGTDTTGEAKIGAAWLVGLTERQKFLARLCSQKAEDAQILEELARIVSGYEPEEKPWCFLAIEALLPPSAFWRAFHEHWKSFERPPHGRYLWMLGRRRSNWRSDYMSPNDAVAFAALPDTLPIYRELSGKAHVALSWRLYEGGANRHRKAAFLVEARAPKTAVAGIYSGTEAGDYEIVLFSSRAVADVR